MLPLFSALAFASTTLTLVDADGFPYPGVRIVAVCGDDRPIHAVSDREGAASLGLTGQNCWLAAGAPGSAVVFQRVNPMHDPMNITLVLPVADRRPLVPDPDLWPRRRLTLSAWGRDRLRLRFVGGADFDGRAPSRSTLTVRPTRSGTRVRYRRRERGTRTVHYTDTLSPDVWQHILDAAQKDLRPGPSSSANEWWPGRWSGLSLRTDGRVSTTSFPTGPLLSHAILDATVRSPSTDFDQPLAWVATTPPAHRHGEGRYADDESAHVLYADGQWIVLIDGGWRVPCKATGDALVCARSSHDDGYEVTHTARVDLTAQPPTLHWSATHSWDGEARTWQGSSVLDGQPPERPLPPKDVCQRLEALLAAGDPSNRPGPASEDTQDAASSQRSNGRPQP